MATRLCVFGGGKMGSALIGGLIESGGADAGQCAVVDPRAEARDALLVRYPGIVIAEDAVPAEAAILAMKPSDVEKACRELVPGSYQRVLSIAAGVTLSSLESWLWPKAVVIRAMPNTPALVGAGASAVAPGSYATEHDLAWAESILSAVGIVVRLKERDLDAVTGLSGSGPAYVFYLAEALAEAGRVAGLDAEVARLLANQTLLGASRMLSETGESAEDLRAAVTSPNGTTQAGVAVLDERAVRDAFIAAVLGATERSGELGRTT